MVRARISLLMGFLALAAPAWAQGPLTAGVPAQERDVVAPGCQAGLKFALKKE